MEFRVYSIWFNNLAADDRSEWIPELFSDPGERVVHFWDEQALAGAFFAEDANLPDVPTSRPLWDAFVPYGPEAVWTDVPAPLVTWGRTVIDERENLRASLLAQL